MQKNFFLKAYMVRRIMIVGILVFGISFLIIESFVISDLDSNDSQIHDVDYVVILGAGLKGSELSKTLKQRLDASLNYISNNKYVPIIVSGGRGRGEDIPEAEAMKQYLINKNIYKDRIVMENKSTTTEENLLFSKNILNQKGFKNPKIIIVTSDYHMFRAKLLARRIGFAPYGISSKSPLYFKIKYMIREYFAIINTIL